MTAPDIFGGSRIARFSGAQDGAIQDTQIRYPASQFPPPNAQHFTLEDWNDFAGAGNATPAGLRFSVPEGQIGVIDSISFYFNDMLATTDVRYTVRVNRNPIAGFNRVRPFPTAAAFRGIGRDKLGIELDERVAIEVFIEKTDATAQRVGASIAGWTYPKLQAR